MQKHVKNYLDHFGFTEADFIPCEICSTKAVDIHHVLPRSAFGSKEKHRQDHHSNLIALCRKCHELAHAHKITKQILVRMLIRDGEELQTKRQKL